MTTRFPRVKWIRVSRSERCPVCDHADYCSRSPDGLIVNCMRVLSAKANRGKLGGWIHSLADPLPAIAPRREEPPPTPEHWQRLAEELATGTQRARQELATKLGVSVESLKRLGVGYGSHTGHGGTSWFWSFPERSLQLKVTGINRRYRDGARFYMTGSRAGLYIVGDWWTAPGPILLPEGGSDTAALLTMGLCAIGRPSNTGGVNMLIGALRHHRNRQVIVLAERDRKEQQCPAKCGACNMCWPGLYGAKNTTEALRKALNRNNIDWRFSGDAKDVREWLNSQTNRVDLGGRYLAALTTSKGRAP